MDNKKIEFERKQGEIDIIIDGEDVFLSSVSSEIIDLILSLEKDNEKFKKFKKTTGDI